MEKVSIVVPIYNVENYLKRCIKSLINQTYENIEILLINDGSKDKSKSICESYVDEDKRIKLYNKENGGLSDARNFGIEKATGKYILFVDADDYIEENAIEKLIYFMVNNDLDILTTNAYMEDGSNTKRLFDNIDFNQKDIMTGIDYYIRRIERSHFLAAVWLNMYKTELIKSNKILFKKGILHEDEEWTPRIMVAAQRVMYINFPFYHYIVSREDSIINLKDKTKNMICLFDICTDQEKMFQKMEITKKQHEIINDYLCRQYMNACILESVNKDIYAKNVNYRFVIRNAKKIKTKLKLIVFFINKKLYKKIKEKWGN